MSADFNSFEEMEAYYAGTLSQEEISAFEARLAIDSQLWEEYEEYKKIRTGFKKAALADFRKQLQKTDIELDSKPNKSLWKRIYLPMAAAIFLLAGLFFLFRNNDPLKKYEPEEIGLTSTLSASNTSNLAEANTLFRKKEYSKSFNAYKQLPESDTTNYFMAVCAFRLGQFETAEQHFESVAKNNNSVFSEKADYWLAITFYKLNEKERVKERLERIMNNPTHAYGAKAKELYTKLYGNGE
ncbi:MAG: hypothetical protein H0W61_01230 [Bacteroidetes bacterium]|nr:hypothetical protein [Bacteroidota bacterium]